MIPNWSTNITHKTSFVRLSFLILLVCNGNPIPDYQEVDLNVVQISFPGVRFEEHHQNNKKFWNYVIKTLKFF